MKKDQLKERRQHSTSAKPFSYYISNIPDYFPNVPLHWHKEFELNVILEGAGDFITEDKHFTARKGDIVLTTPDMLHAVYQHGDEHCIYDTLDLDSSMLGSRDNGRVTDEFILPLLTGAYDLDTHITPAHYYYSELLTTAENMISAAKGDSPLLDMLIKSEMQRFIFLLYESGSISRKGSSVRKSSLMRPVIEYINEHFTEPLTVEQLAGVVHLSKSYFMGSFKKETGVGAVEYITQLRLKLARELLKSTEKSVSDIAFECGYHNLSNFNRQFRSACGSSPREFRSRSEDSKPAEQDH
ncbi:MAG: helix-turn-helix transcriptional regulator [Ruminococcus sp.]|nr:helix-turn-helix transcriptional regulator [Ruminococcus sp.]